MQRKPNVVMVILDTVRAVNLSCYGYEQPTTPVLDALCGESVLYRNAFAPAIWTIPSHASLFTGAYPSCHGALNLSRVLGGEMTTLAELLGSSGYETVLYSNNLFLYRGEFGLCRGFERVEGERFPGGLVSKLYLNAVQRLTGMRDRGAAATNLFVERFLAERSGSPRPFFLFLNYMEAHAPYKHVPRRFMNRFVPKDLRKKVSQVNQDRQKYLTRSIEMSEEDFRILKGLYDAQIAYLDERVGDLLESLKRHGSLDNTILFILSDHGDLIGEHDLVHHSYCLYEEVVRVPLIVRLPGATRGGAVVEGLVSLIDIPRTIPVWACMEGETFASQAQGEVLPLDDASSPREFIYLECERPKNEFEETYPDFDFSVYDRQLLGIRSKERKFIWASDGKHELYDLLKDPREGNNLFETEKEAADALHARLLAWYGALEKRETTEAGAQVDREITEKLRALGYF